MKTYILIGAAGGYISGGPIYQRNKAIYLQSKGWKVYYISCRKGHIYIKGLESFVITTCPLLSVSFYLFSKKKQKKIIEHITKKIPSQGEEIVIETGTYSTAYWGELLAQHLKAKHLVVYLDEHNDGIKKELSNFFHFKYKRNELACITKQTMVNIFNPFWSISEQKAKSLLCYCSNSLEDYDYKPIHTIPNCDFTIGYVGRLEKDALKTCINDIIQFASQNPSKTIAFICIGGSSTQTEKKIEQAFKDTSNIRLFISGYIFPIPLQVIRKCNIIFASAGSVNVATKAGIPTVDIDVYTNEPTGFVLSAENNKYQKCPYGNKVIDYLNMTLIKNEFPYIPFTFSYENDLNKMNAAFEEHTKFLYNTSENKEYFSFPEIKLTRVQILKKIVLSILGIRLIQLLKCK